MKFEMFVSGGELTDEFQNVIKNVKGVKGVYGVYQAYGVKVSNSKETIGELDGITSGKFLDYYDIKFLGNKDTILTDLSMGRNMIIASIGPASKSSKLNIIDAIKYE